jgi:hypothetical protein
VVFNSGFQKIETREQIGSISSLPTAYDTKKQTIPPLRQKSNNPISAKVADKNWLTWVHFY